MSTAKFHSQQTSSKEPCGNNATEDDEKKEERKIKDAPMELELVEKLKHLETELSGPRGKMTTSQNADPRSLLVRGLGPSTTEECIKYYFENTRRSGGGPVNKVQKLEESTALVRFQNAQDAEAVVNKPQLKLDGNVLQVSALHSAHGQSIKSSISPQKFSKVLPTVCSSIAASQTESADLDRRAQEVGRNEDLNPDFQLNAETLTRKQVIQNLSFCQVKVLNQPKMLIQIHKEYPGVEICVDMDAHSAHVKAPETVIDRVCGYVQSMVSGVGEARIPLTPAVCKMYGHEEQRAWIRSSRIDPLDLVCHWEFTDQSLIICAQKSSLFLLEQLFRSLFVEIKVHLEAWEVGLLQNLWTSFWEVLEKDGGDGPKPVLILDSDSIIIVDIPSNISQTQLSLRHFLDEHRNQDSLSSSGSGIVSSEETLIDIQVCKVIPNLKGGQLKVLSCPAVLEKWRRDYPDLQVSVDLEEKTVKMKACENTMKKAFVELMYFITLIREVKVPLSPALVKMFEKEGSRLWVQKVLQDKNKRGYYWEICDQHLVISGQNCDLFRLEQTFKAIFEETTVHLEGWEVDMLTPSVWTRFVEGQLGAREESPEPVLLLEDGRVVIVDLPQYVDFTPRALKQFLNEYRNHQGSDLLGSRSSLQIHESDLCVVENCIPCLKPGQLSILSNPKALAKVYKQYPGLVVDVDKERKTAVVRAPENVMQEAFSDVMCYATGIKEAKIPLSPAGAQMYTSDRNSEWIQSSLIEKYELVCHWDLLNQHLIINAPTASLSRLKQMFKALFKEVQFHLDKTEVELLTSSVWSSFVDKLKMVSDDCPTPVLLLDNDCVTIVDIPSKVSATLQTLKDFLTEQREHHSSSCESTSALISTEDIVEKTIPALKPGQLKVLSCPAVVNRLLKNHPSLEMSIDKETMSATVRAPETVMQKAVPDVVSSLSDVKELKVPLSPALFQMFEKQESKDWIQATLIDWYELECHWELQDQQLIICAPSGKLFNFEHLFKSVFKEVKVTLKDLEVEALSPVVWRSFVREQESERRGMPSPVLLLETGVATVVDTAAKVKDTQSALIQLLNDLYND